MIVYCIFTLLMSLVLDSFWSLYKMDWKNNLENVNNSSNSSSINVDMADNQIQDKQNVSN